VTDAVWYSARIVRTGSGEPPECDVTAMVQLIYYGT